MVQNHTFRFRITKSQFEQIKQDAKSKGYVTVASYLRDLALKRNNLIEEKILETNIMVKNIQQRLHHG